MRLNKRMTALILACVMTCSDLTYASVSEPVNIEESMQVSVYHTVRFYADGQLLTSQKIKEGESAVAPDPLEIEGKYFDHWDKDFSTVTGDLDVTAVYATIQELTVTIQYVYADKTTAAQPYIMTVEAGKRYEEEIPSPIIEGFVPDRTSVNIAVEEGQTEDIVETVTYTGTETTYTVKHMLENLDGSGYTEAVEMRETLQGIVGRETSAEVKELPGFTAELVDCVKIAADGSAVAEVRYKRNSYLLTWDSAGGSYVVPQYLKYGAQIAEPVEPVKEGCDFAGWIYDVGESESGSPQTMPAQNMTATAGWNEKTEANYTVVYWKEKVPESNETASGKQTIEYEYAGKTDGVGIVGALAAYKDLSSESEYQGFELDKGKTNVDVTITADGKAVKNVYYNRRECTITFIIQTDDNGHGNDHWNEVESLKIKAKYGQDISEIWNDTNHSKYMWATSKNSNEQKKYYSMIFEMPSKDLILYGYKKGPEKSSIVYYIENLKENEEKQTTWGLKEEIRTDFESFTITDEDKIEIQGFTYHKSHGEFESKEVSGVFEGLGKEDENKDYYGAYLLYTRNKYKLHLENCADAEDNTAVVQELPYEAPLSWASIPSSEEIRPAAGIDADAVFAGWYTSPTFEAGTEVNWDTPMPAHDMMLYAKWKNPAYTVSFDLNGLPGEDPESITVQKYSSIEQMPTAPGWDEAHKFIGWYYRDEQGQEIPFVEQQQITRDYELYAKWSVEVKYAYTIVCKESGTEQEIGNVRIGYDAGNLTVEAPAIEGYLPVEVSRNVNIYMDGQTIVFYYHRRNTWNLTVRYVDEEGNQIPGYKPEITTISEKQKVVFYKPISGYRLVSHGAVLADAESSEVTFVYRKITDLKYRIEYLLQDKDGIGYTRKEEDTVIGSGKLGQSVNAPIKTYEHFTCITSGDDLTGVLSMQKELVIQVRYDREEYTVTFVDEDGTILGQDENVRYEGNARIPADPTKDADFRYEYTFAGWKGTYENVTQDETVTAEFTKTKRYYRVKYRIAGSLDEETKEYTWGEDVSVKDIPVKEGYTFSGWTAENVEVTEGTFTMPAEDVVFTGSWEKIYIPEPEEPKPEEPLPEPEEPKPEESLPEPEIEESLPEPQEPELQEPEPEKELVQEVKSEPVKEQVKAENYTLNIVGAESQKEDKPKSKDSNQLDDGKVPETDMALAEETEIKQKAFCGYHLLILVMALLLELCYIHDSRERQQRIFELRRKIADLDDTDY